MKKKTSLKGLEPLDTLILALITIGHNPKILLLDKYSDTWNMTNISKFFTNKFSIYFATGSLWKIFIKIRSLIYSYMFSLCDPIGFWLGLGPSIGGRLDVWCRNLCRYYRLFFWFILRITTTTLKFVFLRYPYKGLVR